jgi:hypothetical protein
VAASGLGACQVWLEADTRRASPGCCAAPGKQPTRSSPGSWPTTSTTPERSKAAFEEFFTALGPDRAGAVEAISLGGSSVYLPVTREQVPQARICLDPFHVIKWTNEVVESVYRAEAPTMPSGAGMPERRDWRRARFAGAAGRTSTNQHRQILSLLRRHRYRLWRTWELKEQLRDLSRTPDPADARAYLKRWCTAAKRSRIPAFRNLARRIEKHADVVVAAAELGLSHSRLEGINAKIRLVQRRGFGFYLYLGGVASDYPRKPELSYGCSNVVAMLVDVKELSEDTAKLAAAPLWPLSDDDLTDTLRAAHRLTQAAQVLQAQLVRQADARGVPAAQGYRSTARWLRTLLMLDPQPARELAEAATALRRPVIERAVLDGHADLRQAAVIATTVEAIPADLGDFDDIAADEAARIVGQAEQTMIDMADRLPAYQLRRVGERILAHVAPELLERADEAALTRQEARARRRRALTLSLPVDGLVRVSGVLGAEDAATVQAAHHPMCRPLPEDDRTAPQRRADALVDVCRLALRTEKLPDDGGEPPQLAVTVAYQPLTRTLGTARTDTGQRLSAATVRRLACDARILPVVLGGNSQVLDTGRARRLATGALRRALHVRDQGCAFPDCDLPPRWTDAHHITAWNDGGETSLDNLVLLCRHHHRLVHEPGAGWQIRLGADRRPDFIPPPLVDPGQRPRRNLCHQRQ